MRRSRRWRRRCSAAIGSGSTACGANPYPPPMFTQCPTCKTMFRVTTADLGAADGRVQCSKCEAVFDGHAHLLSDQEAARAPDPRVNDEGPPIGDLFGTSHLIEPT